MATAFTPVRPLWTPSSQSSREQSVLSMSTPTQQGCSLFLSSNSGTQSPFPKLENQTAAMSDRRPGIPKKARPRPQRMRVDPRGQGGVKPGVPAGRPPNTGAGWGAQGWRCRRWQVFARPVRSPLWRARRGLQCKPVACSRPAAQAARQLHHSAAPAQCFWTPLPGPLLLSAARLTGRLRAQDEPVDKLLGLPPPWGKVVVGVAVVRLPLLLLLQRVPASSLSRAAAGGGRGGRHQVLW